MTPPPDTIDHPLTQEQAMALWHSPSVNLGDGQGVLPAGWTLCGDRADGVTTWRLELPAADVDQVPAVLASVGVTA